MGVQNMVSSGNSDAKIKCKSQGKITVEKVEFTSAMQWQQHAVIACLHA